MEAIEVFIVRFSVENLLFVDAVEFLDFKVVSGREF
jgi:hypothetical protein